MSDCVQVRAPFEIVKQKSQTEKLNTRTRSFLTLPLLLRTWAVLVARDVPFSAIQMALFHKLIQITKHKQFNNNSNININNSNSNSSSSSNYSNGAQVKSKTERESTVRVCVCAAVAAAVAAVVTTPLDLLKTCAIATTTTTATTATDAMDVGGDVSVWQCVRVSQLLRGCPIRTLMLSLGGATLFSVYHSLT